MTTTCPSCGEESDKSWRCSECKADLVADEKSNTARMEGQT
jgi:transposase